ncbi:hypothetical protein T265_15811, partial [Opisthorchis viverrini]
RTLICHPSFQHSSPFFSRGSSLPSDRRFLKDRFSRVVSGNNLYGRSLDHSHISSKWSRFPERENSGSRVGAVYPWPPNKAGDRVSEHLRVESPMSLVGTELDRRPPTNLPTGISMAFGRAAPGYYAPRYPNRETCFGSNVRRVRDPNFLYSLSERTLEQYEMCDQYRRKHLSELPETTEYQDRFLAHIPTEKKRTLYRDYYPGEKKYEKC